MAWVRNLFGIYLYMVVLQPILSVQCHIPCCFPIVLDELLYLIHRFIECTMNKWLCMVMDHISLNRRNNYLRCGAESNGVSLQSLSSSTKTQSGSVSVSYSPRRTNTLKLKQTIRLEPPQNHKNPNKLKKVLYISPKSRLLSSSTPKNRVNFVSWPESMRVEYI